MKPAYAVAVLLLLAGGCVTPPPAPTDRPTVSSSRDVVEKHFELYIQRKDMGYMASTYKRGEPVPHPIGKEAQTAYDTLEDFLHVIRRRLFVRILEDRPGVYVVHMKVIRERQGYVPPPTWYSSDYNLYDARKSLLDDAADQTDTVTWHRLGRDLHLEKALLDRIDKRVGP